MSEDEVPVPAPDEKVIEVTPPVMFKGGSFDALRLREPLAMEVQQAEAQIGSSPSVQSLRRYQMALIQKVSGWPLGALEQLPIRKLDEAGRFVLGFTEPGQRTGES